MRGVPWPADRIARFIAAWNDPEVDFTALCERFGLTRPHTKADQLRRQGYPLRARGQVNRRSWTKEEHA